MDRCVLSDQNGTERTKLEQVRIRLNGKSGANRTETELNGAADLNKNIMEASLDLGFDLNFEGRHEGWV